MKYDAIVIGAGFSGAVMAERLANQGGKRVLVLEQRNHIGGNCYDYRNEHGIIVHQYGPHLFHTNKPDVWAYLSQFTQWHEYEHQVLSRVDGKLVPLPFNLNTLDALYPKSEAEHLTEVLLSEYGEGAKVPILELRKSQHPALQQLADVVYNKFFVNYTAKQWGCRPEAISPAVTARVPVVVSRDDRYFHDTWQAIPAEGYTALFKKLLSHSLITVELGVDATQRVRLNKNDFSVTVDGQPFSGDIIFTGQLDALFNYEHGELPYRSLQFDYETLPTSEFQPATTVNYPNEEAFTRITEFKHILPCASDHTTIVREYPQDYDRHDPKRNVPYYPVFTDSNEQAYEAYRNRIQQYQQVVVLGRLADYKYYNMDDAVANALTLFNQRYGT